MTDIGTRSTRDDPQRMAAKLQERMADVGVLGTLGTKNLDYRDQVGREQRKVEQ